MITPNKIFYDSAINLDQIIVIEKGEMILMKKIIENENKNIKNKLFYTNTQVKYIDFLTISSLNFIGLFGKPNFFY